MSFDCKLPFCIQFYAFFKQISYHPVSSLCVELHACNTVNNSRNSKKDGRLKNCFYHLKSNNCAVICNTVNIHNLKRMEA